MHLENKTAIVTGGGTGVGRATCLQLAKLGCRVVVNYNQSHEAAEQLVASIKDDDGEAIAVQGDVGIDDDCQALVGKAIETFDRLDVLVNNAGMTEFIPATELDRVTDDVWQRLMSVNVIGPFHCARAAAAAMRDTAGPDGGEIVNVSSVAGICASGSSIPYAASKAALNNLTIYLARTLAPAIRVNAVAPGFITGDWLKRGLGDRYDETKNAFEQMMPLKKVCEPNDVANAIISVITGSDLVTGSVQVCDGGMLIAEPVRIG
jgi:3-oxoacyl-[acyl-carrier protein] reductase